MGRKNRNRRRQGGNPAGHSEQQDGYPANPNQQQQDGSFADQAEQWQGGYPASPNQRQQGGYPANLNQRQPGGSFADQTGQWQGGYPANPNQRQQGGHPANPNQRQPGGSLAGQTGQWQGGYPANPNQQLRHNTNRINEQDHPQHSGINTTWGYDMTSGSANPANPANPANQEHNGNRTRQQSHRQQGGRFSSPDQQQYGHRQVFSQPNQKIVNNYIYTGNNITDFGYSRSNNPPHHQHTQRESRHGVQEPFHSNTSGLQNHVSGPFHGNSLGPHHSSSSGPSYCNPSGPPYGNGYHDGRGGQATGHWNNNRQGQGPNHVRGGRASPQNGNQYSEDFMDYELQNGQGTAQARSRNESRVGSTRPQFTDNVHANNNRAPTQPSDMSRHTRELLIDALEKLTRQLKEPLPSGEEMEGVEWHGPSSA